MFYYIRILAFCTIAGFILATIFMTPAGATAGAAKGLLLGTFIGWGEWKSRRTPSPVKWYHSIDDKNHTLSVPERL